MHDFNTYFYPGEPIYHKIQKNKIKNTAVRIDTRVLSHYSALQSTYEELL